MNLVQELDKEIIEAMKAKDSVRLATLRGVKGAIKLQSIDHKKEINDELLIDVVSKEIKSRNESIKEFEKGNRQDLIDKTMYHNSKGMENKDLLWKDIKLGSDTNLLYNEIKKDSFYMSQDLKQSVISLLGVVILCERLINFTTENKND